VKKHSQKNNRDFFGTVQFFWHPPSQFPPSVTIQLYKMFNATKIFDPFAGWGDRCVAAMVLGLDYTGVDSNTKLKQLYKNMVDFYPTTSKIKMYFKSCLRVNTKKINFDFVLTSPPFWDDKGKILETYSNMPVSEYHKFMDDVFVPVVTACCLKAKMSCFYIPEYMAIDLMNRFRKWDKIISYDYHGNKNYQKLNIYCFKGS